METGSTAGNSGLNIDATEFFTECTDLFSEPVIEKTLEDGNSVFYYPVSAITEESPIEINVRRDLRNHFDLTATRLHGKFKIVKNDGSAISNKETDDVSIMNILPHGLFKIVDVFLNDVSVIDQSSATYPWKAFFNYFFSYSKAKHIFRFSGVGGYIQRIDHTTLTIKE